MYLNTLLKTNLINLHIKPIENIIMLNYSFFKSGISNIPMNQKEERIWV